MPDSDTLKRTRFNFTKAIPVFEEWLTTREADARVRMDRALDALNEEAITYWSRQYSVLFDLQHAWLGLSPPQRRAMLRTIWKAMEQTR